MYLVTKCMRLIVYIKYINILTIYVSISMCQEQFCDERHLDVPAPLGQTTAMDAFRLVYCAVFIS